MSDVKQSRLAGKVAVITGGSTGFGRGIAALFARHGAKIVIGDLTDATAVGNFDDCPELSTVELVQADGGEALFVECDVTKRADVANLVKGAVDQFGQLDVMVNNAGIHRGDRRIHELTESDLDLCWQVIVKGSWFGVQESAAQFLAQGKGGSIINIVSTAGLRAHPFQSPYNIAKAAQANLTRCAALEYGADNIRANAICPTFIKTAMSRVGYEDASFNEMARTMIPLNRWGDIKDVAELALFLASDESAFITGTLIPLDGGETLGALRSA
jgi:NAD(P)-dependent dehydrogenase (short-subunit alcohol dehydrogenase family)